MTRLPVPTPETYAAAIERAEQAEQLAAQRLDALTAVREAVDIPHAATVGEDEKIRTPILLHRIRHMCVFLDRAVDESDVLGLPWSVAYLREQLTKHAAASRLAGSGRGGAGRAPRPAMYASMAAGSIRIARLETRISVMAPTWARRRSVDSETCSR